MTRQTAGTILASEQTLARELAGLSTGTHARRPGATLLAAAESWSAEVWLDAEAAGPLAPGPGQVGRGMALAARPVFLCGVHRSGTTLLRDLLDGHPALCVLPSEGAFLTSLSRSLGRLPTTERCGFLTREWLRRLANPINREPFWCLGRSTDDVSPYVEYARRVQGWWPVLSEALGDANPQWPHLAVVLAYDASRPHTTESDTPRYWGDKTPTLELHLAKLLETFPSARVIQMIRDPRAVVASRRTLEERTLGRFMHADHMLNELSASMRVALEAESRRSNHLIVRYESLVSAPEHELNRLARFLDIAPHPMLHRATVAGRPSRSNSSFEVVAEPGAIHSSDTADSHVSEFDERLVGAYLGRSGSLLGYDTAPMSPLTALLTRLRIASIARWKAFRV